MGVAAQVSLGGLVSIVLTPAQIMLAIGLFAARLPQRGDSAVRSVCVAVVFELVAVASILLLGSPLVEAIGFYPSQLASFSIIFLAGFGAVLAAFDCSVWSALFCATAGYTLQNLASGITDYICRPLGMPTVFNQPYPLGRILVGIACTAVVFASAYALLIRHIHRRGLTHMEDHSMLIMMDVVIFVIIGFDLVVKWLCDQGLPLWTMTSLRAMHSVACVFTLIMEYELLVNRRLEAERDTLSRVLAERERQYDAARENITAINARVHDIRHAVGRLASADGVGNEALRDLIREVEVYDTRVRTGNEALDTALTERRLRLSRAGVTLTCVADGSTFAFMAPADTYSLFSELLDNVVGDGTTSVSLIVRESLGATSVHVEANDTTAKASLDEAHAITRRNGGTMSVRVADGTTSVDLLFPPRDATA